MVGQTTSCSAVQLIGFKTYIDIYSMHSLCRSVSVIGPWCSFRVTPQVSPSDNDPSFTAGTILIYSVEGMLSAFCSIFAFYDLHPLPHSNFQEVSGQLVCLCPCPRLYSFPKKSYLRSGVKIMSKNWNYQRMRPFVQMSTVQMNQQAQPDSVLFVMHIFRSGNGDSSDWVTFKRDLKLDRYLQGGVPIICFSPQHCASCMTTQPLHCQCPEITDAEIVT